MAGFDPLDWLISLNVERARRAAYTGLLLGAVSISIFGYWMARLPWQLSAVSPTIAPESGECGLSGTTYVIRVNGRTYECGGSDTKCPEATEGPIAYDPEQPSHCRLARNVRRLSTGELGALMVSVLALPYGIAFLAWEAAWTRRGERNASLPLAYTLSRAVFVLSVACFSAYLIWAGLETIG